MSLSILSLVAVCLASLYVYFLVSLLRMGKEQAGEAGATKDAQVILKREEANEAKLSAFFVPDGGQASFVSSLESFCRQAGLECVIESLNEQPGVGDQVKVLGGVVSADGSLAGMERLLVHFESSPYPIIVGKMLLSRENQRSPAAAVSWKGVFDITVPVLIQK